MIQHLAIYYRLSIYRGTIQHDITPNTPTSYVKLWSDWELAKDTHTSPLRASNGCLSPDIWRKNGREISVAHSIVCFWIVMEMEVQYWTRMLVCPYIFSQPYKLLKSHNAYLFNYLKLHKHLVQVRIALKNFRVRYFWSHSG